jgi:hypothetical protein
LKALQGAARNIQVEVFYEEAIQGSVQKAWSLKIGVVAEVKAFSSRKAKAFIRRWWAVE